MKDVPVPATHAAQQVAYAWQVAARELRFTHPELHAHLTEKVRKLLDVAVLEDPAIELHALRRELEDLRHSITHAMSAPAAVQADTPVDAVAPTRDLLQAVADGKRAFTPEQREWCVSEAMVLTGVQRTPVDLVKDGEAALAKLVLDGQPAP